MLGTHINFYYCIGACETVMPNNWLPKQINEEENEKKISSGLRKARESY